MVGQLVTAFGGTFNVIGLSTHYTLLYCVNLVVKTLITQELIFEQIIVFDNLIQLWNNFYYYEILFVHADIDPLRTQQ